VALVYYGAHSTECNTLAPEPMDKELLQLLESGLLDILKDEEFKSTVIDAAASELPLPNFIERRLLSLVYNVLLNFADRIYQDKQGQ